MNLYSRNRRGYIRRRLRLLAWRINQLQEERMQATVDPLADLERILAKIPPDVLLAPPVPRRLLASVVTEMRRLRVVAKAPVSDIADLVEATEHVFGNDRIWQRVNAFIVQADKELV